MNQKNAKNIRRAVREQVTINNEAILNEFRSLPFFTRVRFFFTMLFIRKVEKVSQAGNRMMEVEAIVRAKAHYKDCANLSSSTGTAMFYNKMSEELIKLENDAKKYRLLRGMK